MLINVSCRWSVLAGSLLLISCGGGGGNDSGSSTLSSLLNGETSSTPDSTPVVDSTPDVDTTPAVDPTAPVVDNTPVDDPTAPVVDTTPVDDPTAPVVDNTPVDDDPAGMFGPVSDLFGRALFGYGFTGDEAFFILDATFGPDNVRVSQQDSVILGAIAISAFRATSEDDFTISASVPLSCVFVDTQDDYLCLALFDNGDTANFLFGRLIDGEVLGNFEFCTPDDEDCVEQLLNSPDGPVLVRVDSTVVADTADVELAISADLTVDQTLMSSYLQYGDQISAGNSGARQFAANNPLALTDLAQAHQGLIELLME